jgi:small multidrug resistance pump
MQGFKVQLICHGDLKRWNFTVQSEVFLLSTCSTCCTGNSTPVRRTTSPGFCSLAPSSPRSTLKLSDGLTRLLPTVVVAVGYNLSFVLLAQALKGNLQVSVAYAIWCGVGTAAITVIGMLTLNEPLTAAKILGILMITGGVVTLSFTGTH